jgi:hypothetical protein
MGPLRDVLQTMVGVYHPAVSEKGQCAPFTQERVIGTSNPSLRCENSCMGPLRDVLQTMVRVYHPAASEKGQRAPFTRE